jgi:hypothetical protein
MKKYIYEMVYHYLRVASLDCGYILVIQDFTKVEKDRIFYIATPSLENFSTIETLLTCLRKSIVELLEDNDEFKLSEKKLWKNQKVHSIN